MQANGSPLPEFEFDEDHSYFMVRLPVHPAALEVAESGVPGTTEVEDSEPTLQVTPQVTPQVEELLKVMQGEQSRAELMASLGLKDRSNFFELYLEPALEAGLIEMTVPDKPNSRKQKYRRRVHGTEEEKEAPPPQVTLQVTLQVTPQVEGLLKAMDGELSRAEIMKRLGFKDRRHFVSTYLQPALDVGLIEYTIPGIPNSRLQQYRLTARGRQLLRETTIEL